MGVLGWTYDQTLDTPMQEIIRALNGRRKLLNSLLRSVLGMPDEASQTPAKAPRKSLVAQLAALMNPRPTKGSDNG